jgi:hypothetical protein
MFEQGAEAAVCVQIGNLEPVRPAFAWAQASQVSLFFGQTNFFREPTFLKCKEG